MRRTPLVLALLAPVAVFAQSDRAAGLFTQASQLPLVSQSVVVRIGGGEARVELTQVFANDGPEIAQADYRLHLPPEAVVTGFGFWRDGRFLAAELAERARARRAHTAAAVAGRPTALLQRDGSIHAFSVFPVPAGALQQVELAIALPVVTEGGRSHVRLPLDSFIGHSRLASTVIVHIDSSEPLRDLGVDGSRATVRHRGTDSAELILSTREPVEIWWASEAPPLLARAEAVPLEDGSYAVQVRLALNDPGRPGDRGTEVALLIDASYSMRRRGRALRELMDRIWDNAPMPVRVFAVADRVVEVTAPDHREVLRRLASGEAGFTTSWTDLVTAAATIGCEDPARRCIAVTDPQVLDLPPDRALETLFLADADELVHFDHEVGCSPAVYQPDVESTAALHALADELVLPVLELRSLSQGGDEVRPVGGPRLRVAAGGLLRLFLPTRSTAPLRLELAVAGRPVERTVPIQGIDPSGRQGRALRRGMYGGLLRDWMDDYRRSRDPELRRQIVDVSLRERIPTELTALHAASPEPALPRTASWARLLRLVGLLLLALGCALLLGAGRPWIP